jgi:hypothetical protein
MLVTMPDNWTTGDFTIKRYLRYIITTAQWRFQRGPGWSAAHAFAFLGFWHTCRETLRVSTAMFNGKKLVRHRTGPPRARSPFSCAATEKHTITESDTVQLPSSDQIRRKSACGGIHKTASTGFIEALVRADMQVYERPS